MAAGYKRRTIYRRGPGALHNWADGEVMVLLEAGYQKIEYVVVPDMGLTVNPITLAEQAVADLDHLGLTRCGVLDTEYQMRANPQTPAFEATFGDTILSAVGRAATYAGGFTMARPPKYPPWWIGVPAADGTGNQTGGGQLNGLGVDFDQFGPNFPYASPKGTPAPPPPPAPFVPHVVVTPIPGGTVEETTISVPLDSTGRGWLIFDGTDQRVNHLIVPWAERVSVEPIGNDPRADGYSPAGKTVLPSNRGGYLFLEILGGAGAVTLVTSQPVSALTPAEAKAAHGDRIITADNWHTVSPPADHGGQHDPRNNQAG